MRRVMRIRHCAVKYIIAREAIRVLKRGLATRFSSRLPGSAPFSFHYKYGQVIMMISACVTSNRIRSIYLLGSFFIHNGSALAQPLQYRLQRGKLNGARR